MVISLTVAWATPVDCVVLGARLESYVETKAAISTFRICTQHAPSGTSLARLPVEVLGLVGALVQDFVFEDRQRVWIQDLCCCQCGCRPMDHFSDEEVSHLKNKYLGGDYEFLEGQSLDFEDELRGNYGGEQEHDRRIGRHLRKIEEHFRAPRSDVRFMRCRKIFTQDFGLEIFFTTLHASVPDEYRDPSKAPVLPPLLTWYCRPYSQLSKPRQIPSYEQEYRFKKAMNALQLTPNIHEEHLRPLHPTSIRLPEPAKKEYGEDAMSSSSRSFREAQALESADWPKLMALVGGRHGWTSY